MRLLLFSDLHLDAPFPWADEELARACRRALRRALSRICQLAGDLAVDAVCCAGDLFEHDRCAPDTARFLRDSLAALDPIPVFLAPGEQDWLGPTSAYRYALWSDNVRIFTEPRLRPLPLADGLTLWGAAHCAPAFTPGFLDGFHVDRSGVNLALFHGCESGEFARHDRHAVPLAPFHAHQITDAGLDHALVGHLHRPSATPRYTYPGNPQPLTFGEVAGERGAVLVTVGPDGSVTAESYAVPGTRLHDVEANLDGVGTTGELRERVARVLAHASGIARVTLFGSVGPRLDLDAAVADLAGVARHLDRLIVRRGRITVAYDVGTLSKERTVRGQFVQDLRSAHLSEDQRARVLVTGLRALEGRSDLAVP